MSEVNLRDYLNNMSIQRPSCSLDYTLVCGDGFRRLLDEQMKEAFKSSRLKPIPKIITE